MTTSSASGMCVASSLCSEGVNKPSVSTLITNARGGRVAMTAARAVDCAVGDGGSSDSTRRGDYNITIQQNFRLNGTDFFTIFDLPISVTNSISEDSNRPSCDELNNPLLSDPLNASSAVIPIPYLNGAGVDNTAKNGFGAMKPVATPENGIDSGGAVAIMSLGALYFTLIIGAFLVL